MYLSREDDLESEIRKHKIKTLGEKVHRNKLTFIMVIMLSLFFSGCKETVNKAAEKIIHNTLTEKEKSEGWQLLFDGKTTNNWHKFNKKDMTDGWIAENGELIALDQGGDIGGDIVSDKEFSNFDLKLEWKISAGGNSGIFYHVKEGQEYKALYTTGPEYQLIDDVGFPQKLEDWQKTGANYAMHLANDKKRLQKVGEWNSSRIVVKDSLVQHYLNGEKIIEFKQWTDDWNKRKLEGKWKESKYYGTTKTGKIGLQDHGKKTWFRNIKIRSF